jgi:hypothetical protein
LQINLDLQLALQTILGAWPEIKALRDKVAEQLPAFDIGQLDKLEEYALALMYVQSRYAFATKPPDDLVDVVTEASRLRDRLFADAQALALRDLFDARKLTALKGGNSYKNLASDLQALTTELEAIFPSIQGKAATTPEELQAATQMATRLTRIIGVREQSPGVVAALTDERLRAFTQLIKAYDDARAAVSYLRRREGDVDDIAPNLYSGNTKPRKVDEPATSTPGVPPGQLPLAPLPSTNTAAAMPSNGGGVPAVPAGSTAPFGS